MSKRSKIVVVLCPYDMKLAKAKTLLHELTNIRNSLFKEIGRAGRLVNKVNTERSKLQEILFAGEDYHNV